MPSIAISVQRNVHLWWAGSGKVSLHARNEQEAEETVAEHVSGFAQNVVPWLELRVIHSEEEMERWVQDPAGFMGREVACWIRWR